MVKGEILLQNRKKALSKNKWVEHVKKLAKKKTMTFKDSLVAAKETYHKRNTSKSPKTKIHAPHSKKTKQAVLMGQPPNSTMKLVSQKEKTNTESVTQ
jgi:hypothetical protein